MKVIRRKWNKVKSEQVDRVTEINEENIRSQ